MLVRQMRRLRAVLCGILIVALVIVFPVQAEAADCGRLIQTVSAWEEYEGLLHLGLLETEALRSDESSLEEAIDNVMAASVKVRLGIYHGSGVIWDITEEFIYIVTNQHVLMHGTSAEVSFTEELTVAAELCGSSQQYDVGFLRIAVAEVPVEQLIKLRYVRIDTEAFEALASGDRMFLIGSADRVGEDIYMGTVADPEEYFPEFHSFMIHNHCYGKPGMSGAGTFDGAGNYIGMLTGGLDDETASLPVSVILEEYEEIVGRTRG